MKTSLEIAAMFYYSYFAYLVCLKLDGSVYTCLTQLYGGRDMYNLLHKDQLHVSASFIGRLQVDN